MWTCVECKTLWWALGSFPVQVFQTFACDDYYEINEHRLRADGRIECYTATHKAYMVYAGIMVCLCEL